MHDIKTIRDDPAAFDRALARRGLPALAEDILAIDTARRACLQKLQGDQARRNAASKEIGQAMGRKDQALAEALMTEVAGLKDAIQSGETMERDLNSKLDDVLSGIPNSPLDEVPDGKDAESNVESHRWGEPRNFDFEPRQHFEIGEGLGLMDFETAAKISGARFVVLTGALARLDRALAAFMLDFQTGTNGYLECQVPYLVKSSAMRGTGQLPKFSDDLFESVPGHWDRTRKEMHDTIAPSVMQFGDNATLNLTNIDKVIQQLVDSTYEEHVRARKWLIPTAEVSLTNMVREAVIDEAALPVRFTAHTPCFRAEAGAAGKDTRGMIRQHQFSKVELVSITTPERSRAELERMTGCAEEVLKRLDLPYRVMTLCTGDMGFSARMTYDIEVWLPGQNAYREISSCSVCGDFQARRMEAKYKPAAGGPARYVHTLNGSGLAVGRTLIAVLENYQNQDGSVTVPAILRPYMGGIERIA